MVSKLLPFFFRGWGAREFRSYHTVLACFLFVFKDRVSCSPHELQISYVAVDDPELLVTLPPPLMVWRCRRVPSCTALLVTDPALLNGRCSPG